MSDIRVLIADDDQIIREGLAILLNHQDGLDVVATASNGAEALDVVAMTSVDVALVDVDMPVMDGIATAEILGKKFPAIVVVMLTAFEHRESLAKSLEKNVRGFLTKDIPSVQLGNLIKQAFAGIPVMGPGPTAILTQEYLQSKKDKEGSDEFRNAVEQLSPHLRDVFDTLIQGKPNKRIARELGLSEATVRSYVSDIFTATGVTNRAELAINAIKAGY